MVVNLIGGTSSRWRGGSSGSMAFVGQILFVNMFQVMARLPDLFYSNSTTCQVVAGESNGLMDDSERKPLRVSSLSLTHNVLRGPTFPHLTQLLQGPDERIQTGSQWRACRTTVSRRRLERESF